MNKIKKYDNSKKLYIIYPYNFYKGCYEKLETYWVQGMQLWNKTGTSKSQLLYIGQSNFKARESIVIWTSFPPKNRHVPDDTAEPQTKPVDSKCISLFSAVRRMMMASLRNLFRISSATCLFLYLQLISTVGQDDILLQQLQEQRTVTLRTKRPGAPFKIAMFADLHFGEAASTDWGPAQDANSIKVMSSVLDNESPGDVIDACSVFFCL